MPDEAWEKANRYLHAVMRDHSVSHDEVKAYAIEAARRKGRGIDSTKQVSSPALRYIAEQIQNDPETFKADVARLRQDDDLEQAMNESLGVGATH